LIAVDTNILVYAHRSDAPNHGTAKAAIEELGGGREPWTVPWPCVHEFLAIVTHPRVWTAPTPMSVALDAVRGWFESTGFEPIGEGAQHLEVLERLLTTGGAVGPKVHDGRIAAICSAHGVRVLWSADRDFGRFSSPTVVNPLVRAD
jgi:hypothetical protein